MVYWIVSERVLFIVRVNNLFLDNRPLAVNANDAVLLEMWLEHLYDYK